MHLKSVLIYYFLYSSSLKLHGTATTLEHSILEKSKRVFPDLGHLYLAPE